MSARSDSPRNGRSPAAEREVDGARLRLVRRIRSSVRNRLLLANLAGATVVFLVTEMGLRATLPVTLGVWETILGVLGLFVVFSMLATIWAHLAFARSVAWVIEQRNPTPAERADVLRLPWQSALRPFLFWGLSAVVYPAVAVIADSATVETVLKVSVGILLGGVVTCALGFLLIERSFTGLFAIALAGSPPKRPATLGVRMRLALAWAAGSAVPLIGVLIAFLAGNVPPEALVILGIAGLGAGLLATLASANSLADPLDEVRDALARVGGGHLDVDLVVDDGGEIGQVQAGFNEMVQGLRDRERVRDLFGRHVGRPVMGHALERGTGLGGEHHHASVIFVDIVGSTALAEALSPDEVVGLLNDFFDVVVRTVDEEGGWVNKFEGDGALCVFGVPVPMEDHAERAVRAARRLRQAMEVLAERHPGLEAGIGVSSGHLVAGNVGTESRLEYTVIGGPVNEAARLTTIAKDRPMKVLASRAAIERAGEENRHWQEAGTVALRGQAQPVDIYTPMPVRVEI